MSEKYSDIIHLPHHSSKVYPPMPMSDRAAQFSPFAALTGYDAAIDETIRMTDKEIFLSEDSLSLLDAKLQILQNNVDKHTIVRFTHFKPDPHKEGGEYITSVGTIRKIDTYSRVLFLTDGTKLLLDQIIDIECDLLNSYFQK